MKGATVLSSVIGKFAYLDFIWRGVRMATPRPTPREMMDDPVLKPDYGPYGRIHVIRVGGEPNVSSSVVTATMERYTVGRAPGGLS